MNRRKILTEIAVFTPHSALAAYNAGADRIELCSGFAEGGLSPSAGTIDWVRQKINIPLHVMIRPRVGDFVYSKEEKQCIIRDIIFCRENQVNGVVVGALNERAEVDTDFISELLQIAFPMQVTFHRAFDLCPHLPEALDDLISCGVHRVLTSGGQPNALMGKENILQLEAQSRQRIIILPGGGLTPTNVREFAGFTGVSELHFSAKELVASPMKPIPQVSLYTEGHVSDLQWYECSSQKITAIQKELSFLPE